MKKKATSKPNIADITIILDRSGSMSRIREDTIGGFNSFIDEQRKGKTPTTVSLVQFDHEFEVVYQGKEIKEVKDLTHRTYVPRGSTALLDAMGRTLSETRTRIEAIPKTKRPNRITVLVLTDGEENSSREFYTTTLKSQIEVLTKEGWQILFIGANQDAVLTAKAYGIAPQNALSMSYSGRGAQSALRSASSNVQMYSGGMAANASFSVDDKQEQEDLLKKLGG